MDVDSSSGGPEKSVDPFNGCDGCDTDLDAYTGFDAPADFNTLSDPDAHTDQVAKATLAAIGRTSVDETCRDSAVASSWGHVQHQSHLYEMDR